MKAYLALIRIDLQLALRNRSVIFFNYLFPLLFFFAFAQFLSGLLDGRISYIVSMVLVLGILGNGLFGAGMRAVQEREQNILRRFKVAPIRPTPLLVASMVTGWVIFIPTVVIVLSLAHFVYDMPIPDRLLSLFVLISLGVIAFRAIGLILAAVANSMQESNILIQLLYMPMLFLSGATFPLSALPGWARITAQFLPASYLVSGFQGVFHRNETLLDNTSSVVALLATTVLATFVSTQLFRWEKEEKIPGSAKLWILAVLLPFLILGIYELWSREHLRKADALWQDLEVPEAYLIRNARIFVGDGRIVERGSLLIREGVIHRVGELGAEIAPGARVETIEAEDLTLLPGFIDAHAHLAAPAGRVEPRPGLEFEANMERALRAYLYSGVTTVLSAGDPAGAGVRIRDRTSNGEHPVAQLLVLGPTFTAKGGYGAHFFADLPDLMREVAEAELLRLPETPEEAVRLVRELVEGDVDGIKLVMDAGVPDRPWARMDLGVARAIGDEVRRVGLRLVAQTRTSEDVRDAIDAGATAIVHGSHADEIPDDLLGRMAREQVALIPALSALDAARRLVRGDTRGMDGDLTRELLGSVAQERMRRIVEAQRRRADGSSPAIESSWRWATDNLRRAHRVGVGLVTGTHAGRAFVFHGTALHRELELWVEAGLPPGDVLKAATGDAARYLGLGARLGRIEPGLDADLVLVEGDPTRDITHSKRIKGVFLHGRRVSRSALMERPPS